MVIVFKPGAPEENKAKMRSNLESKGFQINEINGVNMTIFGIIGDTSTLDINMLRRSRSSELTACSIRRIP